MSWKIVYTNQAQKDAKKIAAAGLKEKVVKILRMWTHYECPDINFGYQLDDQPCYTFDLTGN